jgi:O-antigen/teichoic acid export membrane protein
MEVSVKGGLKPTLLLACGRGAAFAVTFMIPVILVRTFDQAAFGSYKQLFLIYGTLFSLMQFGMAESLYYFLPKQPEAGGRLAVNATILLVGCGGITALALYWQAERVASWLHNAELAPLLPWLGIYTALTLTGASLDIAMVARKRFGLAAVTICLSEMFRATLFVLPALITKELRWLLIGGIAFGCMRLCAVGVFAIREFPGNLRPDTSLLRQQLGYALPFQVAALVEALQVNLHQYAVSHHFDAATFAIYAVGCLQIPAADLIAMPAGNVMMVRMQEEIREGRSKSVLGVWKDTTSRLLMLLLPLTGFLIVASRDLILLLYTEAYRSSISIFAIWALATILPALQTDAVLRVYADLRSIFALNLLRLIVVASLVRLAISGAGLIGPVIVTLAAAMLAKTLALARIARLMSVRLRDVIALKTIGYPLIVTVLSCLVTLGARNRFEMSPLAGLGLVGSVYTLCCATALAAQWRLKSRTVKTCAELPESSA